MSTHRDRGRCGGASRAGAALAALLLPLIASAPTGVAQVAEPPKPAAAHCSDVWVPAKLDLAVPVTVHGRYCEPTSQQGRTQPLQVLVPGASYNGKYWDYQYKRPRYSYVDHANAAGFPTLAIDRVGSGLSSKPPSALLTSVSQADVIRQVVRQVKRGKVTGAPHDKVVLVGHSLGSAIVQLAAGGSPDVDGLVLTGVTHRMNQVVVADLFARHLRPALLDPAFGLKKYDPGYFTTVPGHRGTIFHSDRSEPGIAQRDERTKDVFSVTVAPDAVVSLHAPLTKRIKVPVLQVNGQQDKPFCGGLTGADCSDTETLRRQEQVNFAPEAESETYVLPNAGHTLNAMPNAEQYMAAVNEWVDRKIG